MQTYFVLLRFITKALLNTVGGGVAGDFAVEVLPEVAHNVWAWWSKAQDEPQRRAEVEALARAPDAEIRQWVRRTVDEVAVGQPPEVRQALETYLQQVPGAIRQSLRRPTDPTGMTVPAGLVLRRAHDLLSLLPKRQPRFLPGDQPLANVDWELVELLGVGGFGEVWKARNPHRPRAEPVALKFCLDPAAAEVLRNEVQVLDRVMSQGKHPGIVALRQTYLRADPPCLEFDLVEGSDLAGLIQEWHQSGNRPTPLQAAKVMRRLAEAVGFAHQLRPPIVHRDLKPANVLVHRSEDGKLQFQISDFGLGCLAALPGEQPPPGDLFHAEYAAYTPLYASPEQMRGEPSQPTDDVYALGVIWYQVLTGDLTRGAPTGLEWPAALKQRGMSEAELHLLASCIDSQAANRPANAAVLAERLHQIARPRRKRLGGVVLSVLVLAALGSSWFVDYPALLEKVRPTATTPDSPVAGSPGALPEEKAAQFLPPSLENSLGMKLVLIPPGTFRMGSPEGEDGRDQDEGPQHAVTLTRPFYLSACPVTQAQYQQVMGSNPSQFSPTGKRKDRVAGLDTARFPVENVTHEQAEAFCRRLSERSGEQQPNRLYRLPTEAEWEYACRAGTTTPLYFGATLSASQANFDGRYPYGAAPRGPFLNRTTAVGSFPANAFGLYDMHGNVREWCADGYAKDTYQQGPRTDPQAPRGKRSWVIRGGCWDDEGRGCRSAVRREGAPNFGYVQVGFRVAFTPPTSPR
jgi:formylglycine-generating enzyme required for sulfatase activity